MRRGPGEGLISKDPLSAPGALVGADASGRRRRKVSEQVRALSGAVRPLLPSKIKEDGHG